MRTSESIKDLAAALAKAQGAMENAAKDSVNSAFKDPTNPEKAKGTKYADLASIVDAVKKPFADNGLSYIQSPISEFRALSNHEGHVVTVLYAGVQMLIMHSSGQFIEADPFLVPIAKADAQGATAGVTYARKSTLASMAGIAQADDDGNTAAGVGAQQAPNMPSRQVPPKPAQAAPAPPQKPAEPTAPVKPPIAPELAAARSKYQDAITKHNGSFSVDLLQTYASHFMHPERAKQGAGKWTIVDIDDACEKINADLEFDASKSVEEKF